MSYGQGGDVQNGVESVEEVMKMTWRLFRDCFCGHCGKEGRDKRRCVDIEVEFEV